jgi:hypothetical protein
VSSSSVICKSTELGLPMVTPALEALVISTVIVSVPS